MQAFFQADEHPARAGRAGVKLREVEGQSMTLVEADLAPGNVTPDHRHAVEVVGVVVKGSISLRIGAESRDLRAGDLYKVPQETDHSAEAGPDGVTVIEVFASSKIDPASDMTRAKA